GTKDGIDSAVEMITRLDVPPGTPGQMMQVYTLLEAPASTVGEMIDRVFQERNQPRQGATGAQVPNVAVTVEANDATNSLLINASREDHILVADLVKRLDRPSTIIDMVKVFPLERARAERVKEILEELYQSAGGGEGQGGRTIAVVEDNRTNAVVVAAPPGELENIKELVQLLDQTEVKGQAGIGVFTCENEDAENMAELLNEIMTGDMGDGGGGGETEVRDIESMLVSFATEDARGQEILLKTIRENVQITHNVRTNSVIVLAPPSSLKLIEHLIRKLDRIQKRPVLVKVFQLVNADATRMVEVLEEMFAYEEGSEEEREFQQGREMNVEGGVSGIGGVPSAMSQEGPIRGGTFGRPKTTFVAEERTNSIISAGWPEDIDVVADIIDQLDSRAIQERDNVVYTLINSAAEDVQSALEAYFQAEQQRLDRLGETLSPQRRMEQEVSIVAHEESNQLIVSASPRYKSEVLSIVEQLDIPPPQVMIQVMIAEVTLDDRFQMGLEFALQQLRFSETAVPGGNGILQSSSFDVVGGTDLGAAGAGLAGFSFTITGEDFNFLVRALQADSRLEVIQRPMIMCQDNQEASIIIGQQVPFVRGTQVTANGQVTSQVEYEEVGIQLDVEPHINPDGFVYMHVVQEISAFADSTIDIGNGVLAPIFTERSADTWVAVKDGETVVIGGLITTLENESESKVPFLGDIPGLGILFRTTSRSKQKTELLIALTPRIIRTVEDGRRMSIEARDKGDIITPNMKQSPLFEGLQVSAEDGDLLDDLETPPEQITPDARPQPAEPIRPEPEKKYGPQAPRYGPRVPAGEEAIARRAGDTGWWVRETGR
ncbi:MAG: secretin N-terminal domain-containing protein, partial [Dehalococcoidia bacterium]